MAVSDDELEDVPEFVTNYCFEDDKEEPISFSVLPVYWDADEPVAVSGKQIYVRGKADGGIIYKPVQAWKFDISGNKDEISVLCKDNSWIKLQKPRNSYEGFIRTVLITVKFLLLVKRNAELPGKGLWDKLSKIFSSFEVKPSQYDLVDHKALIERVVERDDSLKKSKYLMAFLEKKLHKKNRDLENGISKGRNDFIVDDCAIDDPEEDHSVDVEDDADGDEEAGDEDDCCDSVCFICDEGGSLLCCEGRCMRSFHATLKTAEEAGSGCTSLGLTEKEVEATEKFECQNCKFKLHQCYSCGRLGSSDKDSVPEVFQCVNATCGYFYHPGCVAKRLHHDSEDAAKELQKNISAGQPFTCPLHVCFVCGQPENNSDAELRMAVCRRCPKAYHKKCLPRDIPDKDDEDAGVFQRAWDGLLVDRILIYCLDHVFDEDLGTPSRDHIKFPGDDKKWKGPATLKQVKNVDMLKKRLVKKKLSRQGSALEPEKKILWKYDADKNDIRVSKPKGTETPRNLSVLRKTVHTKLEHRNPEELEPVCCKPDKLDIAESSKFIRPTGKQPAREVEELVPEVDSDSGMRILNIMKEATSTVTLDDVIMKRGNVSRAYKQKMDVCKNITLGKVEGFCKAIEAAAAKIDGGGNIEEAKAICEPKILTQVDTWKKKLRVYLAPFLYGYRYTSHGRHFTKVDKLKEIVDRIHWYVNNNDTIVDFCCGANDFSWLLKQKLESMGKTCHYRNYDLFQPKNDFNFEKRNWMSVKPEELPTGSQLIMGLNPPFGPANQFINKALEFKPKLLILIVPLETERLDKKRTPYDLVWEDRIKLSGKSFYIPGSADVIDNQVKQMEDWNIVAPVLYLWSRPDWTAKHKAIAEKHDHPHGRERECNKNQPKADLSLKLETTEVAKVDGISGLADGSERLKKRAADVKQTAVGDHKREKPQSTVQEISKRNGDSRKRRHSQETHVKEVEFSRGHNRRRSSPLNTYSPPISANDHRRSSPINYRELPTNVDIRHPNQVPLECTSSRDARYLSGLPLRDAQATYPGRNVGVDISGSRYDDRTVNYAPHVNMHPDERWTGGSHQANYLPSGSSLHHDYFPNAPESYYGSQHYSEPEQRFRTTALSSGSAYNANVSTIDKYGLRLDDPNFQNMGAYGSNRGPPPGSGSYNHPGPHSSVPMGFAQGPAPFYHHHPYGSSGGWVDD